MFIYIREKYLRYFNVAVVIGDAEFMYKNTKDIKVISVVPRCQQCKSHSDFVAKNKKTGETRHLCKICGRLQVILYLNNDDWDIIDLK